MAGPFQESKKKKGGGGVFASGWEVKVFSAVFQDFGENMVEKQYFEQYTVLVIIGKNNEKSGLVIIKKQYFNIWKIFVKKSFLFLTFVRFLKHFEDF